MSLLMQLDCGLGDYWEVPLLDFLAGLVTNKLKFVWDVKNWEFFRVGIVTSRIGSSKLGRTDATLFGILLRYEQELTLLCLATPPDLGPSAHPRYQNSELPGICDGKP